VVQSQLMFAQHAANLAPTVGAQNQGTGHPGKSTFQSAVAAPSPSRPAQSGATTPENAHSCFCFGSRRGSRANRPTLKQHPQPGYRRDLTGPPAVHSSERGTASVCSGNSHRLGPDGCTREARARALAWSLGALPMRGVLVDTPSQVRTLDGPMLDEEHGTRRTQSSESDEQRDACSGEVGDQPPALMDYRAAEGQGRGRAMTRADRSLIRQWHSRTRALTLCDRRKRTVLTERRRADALRETTPAIPPAGKARRLACWKWRNDDGYVLPKGWNGEMLNRPGTPWPVSGHQPS